MQTSDCFRKSINILFLKLEISNQYWCIIMNLGKKFGTVLIILFLCLSPLGAIDLHQWDNDNSHLNDLNGTDIEIKSINETDESIKGYDVESQNFP